MELFLIPINPIDVFLWTFRKNEKDVVNLYNTLSPVMQIATGGSMLNFGYWDNSSVSPIMAQNKLCDLVGNMAELGSAKSLLDIGSLLIFAILFVFPPLNTLPIPQKTNGTIIIPTTTIASFEFENRLNLFIILFKFFIY